MYVRVVSDILFYFYECLVLFKFIKYMKNYVKKFMFSLKIYFQMKSLQIIGYSLFSLIIYIEYIFLIIHSL
jgi:hypothetical protein